MSLGKFPKVQGIGSGPGYSFRRYLRSMSLAQRVWIKNYPMSQEVIYFCFDPLQVLLKWSKKKHPFSASRSGSSLRHLLICLCNKPIGTAQSLSEGTVSNSNSVTGSGWLDLFKASNRGF